MRATLLFCVVLCFGIGCDETEDTPVEKTSATFEIIEDGAGEPNEKALWPITVGTYFEREYVVESKNGESYRVNILTEAFAPLSIETWRRNDKGLEIVGSTATEISDARLAVPDEVRDGMKWKSASIEFSVKDEGMVDVGAFGTQRAWTIKASGIPKRYIEGIGPISEGLPNGVLVENDTNGPKLPKLQKPTPIEVDDDDSFINVRGIGTVDAVDVKNQKFMAVQNASNLPFGATNPRPQEQDSCFFVEGNNATIVELIEQRTIEMPAVAKGPHINRCAARQDAELGFVKHRGRVKDTFLFDVGITWTDVGPYGHHFRDGKAYAFLNPGIWAGGTELFEFQEDASFDIDTGIETNDRWGQVASANSVPLQHSGKRVHLFQQIQDWVRIAGIEDGKQLPPGPSWYLPGSFSLALTDEGREVRRITSDGLVYSLTNEERNLKTEAVAYAQSLAEEPWVSALKHEGNYIVSRYFDAFAREFPGVRHFRVPATRTAMQLPESFAFRASFPDGAGSYFICIPPDVDVMDIDLKIGGETPRDIFITERADNCHLAVANSQPSFPQIVTANLPNIGPVKAFTSYSEGTRMGGNFPHLVGVRGGGFAGSNALLNDAGQYLYRGNNGFFTTNPNDISIDKSGRGVWVIHNPRKVTLSHSEVDEWPELPFLNQTRILSFSGQDRIYISGTTADGARCVALTTAGELTECESLNGVYLELADGRRCRTDGAQKVWCGDDETEGIQIPRDIIDTVPTAEGFYFSERNDVLSFFDANEHTIVEIGFLKLPSRLDENLFVSTFGTKIYRVEGSSKIEVFDIASLGEYNTPNAKIIVGRNTFLLGVTPFRYDPTK